MKTTWKSAIRQQQKQLVNSFARANHYMEANNGNSEECFPYDNISQSSYGSHKNRNFESRSHHGGSLDELKDEPGTEEKFFMMNGSSGKKNGILSRGVQSEKPHRSVVIDDEDIDAYSPDYEEDESVEDDEESVDDHAGLLDEEEARLR